MESLPGTLDVWGQLPRMKGYTHLALCFPHPKHTTQETITNALEAATRRITTALPWIGGVVLHTGAEPGNSGQFTISRNQHTDTILRVQDRTTTGPAFNDILRSNAASRFLDQSWFSKESSLPDSYTDTENSPAPVLTLTATFIPDGIVLDCAAQHNILDMGGIDQFFRLLASALSEQDFEPRVIEVNSLDRGSIFPLLGPHEKPLDHSAMRCPSSLTPALRPPPPPGAQPGFHHFRFSADTLAHLAKIAETPSIDDALSAFIWSRLSTVRLNLGQSPDTITGFSRAVDCRKTLGIPAEYMGVAVIKTYSSMPYQDLISSTLSSIAAQLRADVQRIRDAHFLRSLATVVAAEPDKSTFNFVRGFRPESWVNASSWAGVDAYRLRFGGLGKPSFVGRPTSKPVQGLLYFLPRMEGGDVEVLLCLKEEEIEGLCADEVWRGRAEYIG